MMMFLTVESKYTMRTGCGFDIELIWTSTPVPESWDALVDVTDAAVVEASEFDISCIIPDEGTELDDIGNA